MKTFRKWLQEDSPANSVAGSGIRGMGLVTGDPNGDITGYAFNNTQAQSSVTDAVQAMADFHNNAAEQDTLDGGDQPQNVLGHKAGMKGGGTANYKGSAQ